MAAAPTPSLETTPSALASGLNAVAAATLWGALLGPYLYPLGAELGLWQALGHASSSCGDDPADFIMTGAGAVVGLALGAAIIGLQVRYRRGRAFGAISVDLLRFFLALTLLSYGFAKVFATQFPQLWANLDTPPSELTPMRVAWQFFGYSRPYQQFLGWAEVVPALLLLSRRFATLGALLAIVVLANVFALNIFFDVCVKLNSGLYLAAALLIFLQDTGRLWQFFISNQPITPRRVATDWFETRRGRRIYQGITLGLALLLLLGTGFAARQTYQYAQSQLPTPLTGVWQPLRTERWQSGQWRAVAATDSLFPARVYFQAGQAVIRNAYWRDRFTCDEDTAVRTITLVPRNENNDFLPPSHWRYARGRHRDTLQLSGRWRRDSLRLQLALVPRPGH
jgi:uncharacterized membrane protein YphA (DoxX/SURF4 family)